MQKCWENCFGIYSPGALPELTYPLDICSFLSIFLGKMKVGEEEEWEVAQTYYP